jgi:diguanylate cyclase (GGDEF)-like protein/PAS domain S-box-containing protein
MGKKKQVSTERVETSDFIEKLPESEQLFSRLANTTSAAIFIVQEQQIRYVNPAATLVTGYTRQELLELRVWQIAHPAYQTILKQNAFRNQWSKDLPVRYELKILKKSGDERWLDITAGEIEFQGESAWLLTAFDITERDLAEQALRNARDQMEIRVQERTYELQHANLELRELQIHAELSAQEAQRQANELEIIIRSMADAVVVYDSRGILRQANAAAIKTFGFDPIGLSRAQVVDRLDVRYPEGRPLSLEEIPSAKAGRGEPVRNQRLVITNFQGVDLTIVASTSPLADREGNIFGSVAVWHDVTERESLLSEVQEQSQRAEELARFIQEERDVLRIIMENTKTHLAYLDNNFHFVLVNSAYCMGSGYQADELIGRYHFEVFPNAENQAIFEMVRDTGKPVEFIAKPFEFQDQPERGVTYWDWTLVPVKDEAGIIRGYVFSLVDVTEKIRAEKDREQLLRELESERSLLQAVIQNAPEAVVLADNQARIIMVNPAAERLYHREVPFGQNYSTQSQLDICYIDGTPYDPRNLPLTRSALDGKTIDDIELMIVWPDGQKRFLLVNTAPIYDRGGQIIAAVGVFRDITNRKQAEDELRKTAKQGNLLAELTQSFYEAGLDPEKLVSSFVQKIAEAFDDACLVRLLSDDETWLKAVAFHHPDQSSQEPLYELITTTNLRVDEGIIGEIFQNGRPLLIPYVSQADMAAMIRPEFRGWLEKHPVRSVLVVPLRAYGPPIGTLEVFRLRAHEAYTLDDQEFLQEIARRASLAIENARLFAAQERRARQLNALQRATAVLLSTLELEPLLGQILDAAISAIPAAEKGALYLTDGTGEIQLRDLRLVSRKGKRVFISIGKLLATRVVQDRQPLIVDDLTKEKRISITRKSAAALAFRSMILAPLVVGEEMLGVLVLESGQVAGFIQADLHLLTSFATTTTTAIRNATLHNETQIQAITDTLTGMYNRRGFNEFGRREIDRSRRFNHPLAALMLDIDHFKNVNDSFSHATGDQILQLLAKRLNTNLRDVDIIGRYGGEEFAVLLPESDLETAIKVAERLRVCVEESPFNTNSGPLNITVSVGVSQYSEATADLESVVHAADLGLYQAKTAGRNRVGVRKAPWESNGVETTGTG